MSVTLNVRDFLLWLWCSAHYTQGFERLPSSSCASLITSLTVQWAEMFWEMRFYDRITMMLSETGAPFLLTFSIFYKTVHLLCLLFYSSVFRSSFCQYTQAELVYFLLSRKKQGVAHQLVTKLNFRDHDVSLHGDTPRNICRSRSLIVNYTVMWSLLCWFFTVSARGLVTAARHY